MSDAIESWKKMFKFVARFPHAFLFAIVIQSLVSLGQLIMTGGEFISAEYLLTIQGLGSALPGVSLLYMIPWLRVAILELIFGLVVMIVAYLVAAAGYPILVSQGFEQGKIQLVRVFKDGASRIFDVLLYILAMIGIAIVLGLGGFLFGPLILIPIFGWFVVIFYVLFAVWIIFSLWLVLPVLMVERTPEGRKLGVREAFVNGWKYTSGKALSILGTLLLLFITVLLPLNIVSNYVVALLTDSFLIALWRIVVGIFTGVFSAILPTVYYYTSVRKIKL